MSSRTTSNARSSASVAASGWVAWLPLVVVSVAAVAVRNRLEPWVFMWALAVAIYASLKWASWWRAEARRRARPGGSLGYLVAWPGIDAESFLDESRQVPEPVSGEWVWAFSKTIAGVVLLWVVAPRVP